jgi:hypothetical protein
MLSAAKEGDTDKVKKLTDDIAVEIENMKAAVKKYAREAAEVQKFNAKKPVVDVYRPSEMLAAASA